MGFHDDRGPFVRKKSTDEPLMSKARTNLSRLEIFFKSSILSGLCARKATHSKNPGSPDQLTSTQCCDKLRELPQQAQQQVTQLTLIAAYRTTDSAGLRGAPGGSDRPWKMLSKVRHSSKLARKAFGLWS